MLPLKTLQVVLPIFIIILVPANSQLCQKCDQTISGRNFNYADVLEIIQDEDYLEEADFDDIRRHRYKRHTNRFENLTTILGKKRSKRQSVSQINEFCEKLQEITNVARASAANTAAILAEQACCTGYIENELDINTIVNSNRVFINSLASISTMDCSTDASVYDVCTKLQEVTQVARSITSDGNLVANLVDADAGGAYLDNELELNTIINSNRIFINNFAAIDDVNCNGRNDYDLFSILQQITQLARANAADGNLVANLLDLGANTGDDISGETLLNAIVNSNRIFINALIAILDFEYDETDSFLEGLLEFLRENAPRAAAVGAVGAVGAVAANPVLPMTAAASGVPPGNALPGTPGGGGPPNGAPPTVLALVPAGLNAVAVFPPFATPRTVDAEAVIFAEDPSIGPNQNRRKRRSIFRSVRTLYHRTARYLTEKVERIKYAIEDFKYRLKHKFPLLHEIENKIEEKVEEKMDEIACLQSRLEYYGNERKKKLQDYQSTLNGDYNNHYDHYLIKRAINSFDDCFDFIDEPKYGFRVNITKETPCSELGDDCDIQNILRKADTQFAVRQTGENFGSDAPPDCRLIQCGTK